CSVAGAGDVNGDGYADVVVGASQYDAGHTDEGAVFVFLGGVSGVADATPAGAATMLESNSADTFLGYSVATAGDVNADGYADLIVGTWGNGTRAFVFHGGVSGIPSGSLATASTVITTTDVPFFGTAVSTAGDVNADGYAEVIVGGLSSASVYRGGAAGVVTLAPWVLTSTVTGGRFGYSVACAGDVNGDGFADLVVGAPLSDLTEADEGHAYVFHGNLASTGRRVLARQARPDGSGLPVQPWGQSYAPDRFRVSMNATHPFARGRAKLEVEHCPIGQPFGSPSCTRVTSNTWTDVGTGSAGAVVSHDVPVPPSSLRRW